MSAITIRKSSTLSARTESGFIVSQTEGHDLYSASPKPGSLPPLKNETFDRTDNRRRSKRKEKTSSSVLYPYIHGVSHTFNNSGADDPSPNTARATSASIRRSKDDLRIHYESNSLEPQTYRENYKVPEPWKAKKIRVYKNGDQFFPGMEYKFKPGRDVVNLERLCDKLTDRIELPQGVRFLFGLDGVRRYVLEEIENDGSYVASSDKKFIDLAYGKRRPNWNKNMKGKKASPVVRLAGKRGDSTSSSGSNNSNGAKPGSRDGRRIKIIDRDDRKMQEVSVLVNLKTIQSWEDVVGDLGKVLNMRGEMKLFTISGQEIRSFSQFKNDFANEDTFYVKTEDKTLLRETFDENVSPVSPVSTAAAVTAATGDTTPKRRRNSLTEEEKKSSRPRLSHIPTLRRVASEPSLRESGTDHEDTEIADGKAVTINVRGQKRIFQAPTATISHNPTPPYQTLEIDWVYGYRGVDTRKNLWVLPSGEMVYFVAAVVVLYDRKREQQRHYTEHTEDIQCMAIHPLRPLVASGQRAARGFKMSAHVRIWSTKSLNTLHVLGRKELGVGVMALSFSVMNKGQYLLAIDADEEHLLSVWTWETEKFFGKVATHQDHVYGASFHPMDNNLIIIYGRSLLSLWKRRKDGIFQRSDLIKESAAKSITSLEFAMTSGDLIAGDADGIISIWTVDLDGNYHAKMHYEAHEGPVSCLQPLSEGTVLSGGERDRKIIAWDTYENFERVAETAIPDHAGGVRSIYPQTPGQTDGNIYVGTTRNMILEGSLQRKFNQIVFGHSKQLWGLAVSPKDGSIATAGYDRNIVRWKENKPSWRIQAQSECISVTFHPKGSVVAAGTIDGHLVILNAFTGMHVTTIRVGGSAISCLAFNAEGTVLAAGSQNGSLYLFNSIRDGFVYNRQGRISAFQPLSGLDWSESGNYIQSSTSDNDVVYWYLRHLSIVKNPTDIRDEDWSTHTSPLGYMVHGMWSGRKNMATQIVTTDRQRHLSLLAAGDSEGYLRLYRYPALSPKPGYHEYKVYTSYVSCARFTNTGDYLYTVGGTDAAFIRWRVD